MQFDHNNVLSASTFALPITVQNATTANFSYLQGFKWGSNLQVGFNNTRSTTDSLFATLSPTLGSNFQARFTQHLLQGFGFAPNTRFIRIAKNNREISDVAFRLQIITTVDQIENMYWDLVFAYENVRVQNESLTFAQKTLSDTQKQVEIGTLAPIETVRAQSTVASDQQQLTLAQTNLQLQQLLMKNALSRTLVDPRLADAEVIPTSTMQLPQQEAVVPTQDLVNDALSHRGELAEARINLKNEEDQHEGGPQLPAAFFGSVWLLWRVGTGRGAEPNQPVSASSSAPHFRVLHKSGDAGELRQHAQPADQFHCSRQRSRIAADHSHSQPGRAGYPDPVRTGIPPGADATATAGEPGSYRNTQRPVCGSAEPRQRLLRPGSG